MRQVGLTVSLQAVVEDLGVGDRQRVEILKALLREPRLLILDEPTAVLSPPEVEKLLALLSGLAADGRAVVLVTHKLDEVLSAADHVTVLREGRTVLSAGRSEVDLRFSRTPWWGPIQQALRGERHGRPPVAARSSHAFAT